MGNNIKKLKKEEIAKVYDIKGRLGTGSFATVKECVRKSDQKVFAVKIIKKSKLNAEELAVVHDEVEIMHKINHPHCVKMFEIFESSKKLYMVVELMTGGELFDRIVKKGSYSEKEASRVIRDVTSAIKYLHEIGIVHRDLKPENLLYTDDSDEAEVKITDFGLAKFKGPTAQMKNNVMTTACGTPGYVAPEVLRNEPYGPEVDLWSIGVILYILLCGFPPFYHESTAMLYRQIKRGQFDFPDPYWTNISDSAKHLVAGLLNVNTRKRFTCDDVLNHPWITQQQAPAAAFDEAHIRYLKTYQARQKLQRGVRVILALNRFRQFVLKNGS